MVIFPPKKRMYIDIFTTAPSLHDGTSNGPIGAKLFCDWMIILRPGSCAFLVLDEHLYTECAFCSAWPKPHAKYIFTN